jgi:PhnB protein
MPPTPTSTIDSYLHFDGNCAEAMRFYAGVLGGELEALLTGAESPVADQLPPDLRHQIMHASLLLGDRRLMASDWMVPTPYPGMHGFSVALSYPTVGEARRVFDSLAAGGRVTMPFEKTFWAEGFGMLVDRFGTPWMVGGAFVPVPEAAAKA